MKQTGSWVEYDTMYIAIHLSETITNQVHITSAESMDEIIAGRQFS